METKSAFKILSRLRQYFDLRNSHRIFSPFTVVLVELLDKHFNLLENIKNFEASTEDTFLISETDKLRKSLEGNMLIIANMISIITNRKIVFHINNSENNTIRKLSKIYNSDLFEIFELNGFKDIFLTLKHKKLIIIPLKPSDN